MVERSASVSRDRASWARASSGLLLALLFCPLLLAKRFCPAIPLLVVAPALVLLLRRTLGLTRPEDTATFTVRWLGALPLALGLGALAAGVCDLVVMPLSSRGESEHECIVMISAIFLFAVACLCGRLIELNFTRRPASPGALHRLAGLAVLGSLLLLLWGLVRVASHGALLHSSVTPYIPEVFSAFAGTGWLLGPVWTLVVGAGLARGAARRRRLLATRAAWLLGEHDGQGLVRVPGVAVPLRLRTDAAPAGPLVVTAPPELPPPFRDGLEVEVRIVGVGTPDELAARLRDAQAEAAAYLLLTAVLLATPLIVALHFPAGGLLSRW